MIRCLSVLWLVFSWCWPYRKMLLRGSFQTLNIASTGWCNHSTWASSLSVDQSFCPFRHFVSEVVPSCLTITYLVQRRSNECVRVCLYSSSLKIMADLFRVSSRAYCSLNYYYLYRIWNDYTLRLKYNAVDLRLQTLR